MTALKVLFIGGSGPISSACSQRCGRPRPRPLRAQPRADVDPPAARRGAPCCRATSATRPRPGPRSATTTSTPWSTGSPSRPSTCRPTSSSSPGAPASTSSSARPRPTRRPPARLPILESTPLRNPIWPYSQRQDRVRGPAGRAPIARTASRPRSCGPSHTYDRTQRALRRRLDRRRAHAAGQAGRRPRRRHLAVDAHPPRRLRQGLRRRCSATRRRSATASTSPPTRC